MSGGPIEVVVCKGPVCGNRRGSAVLTARLIAYVAARGLGERVRIGEEVCLGHCLRGPNVLVSEGGDWTVLYNRMTVEDVERVVDAHVGGGMAVRPLMNRMPIPDR